MFSICFPYVFHCMVLWCSNRLAFTTSKCLSERLYIKRATLSTRGTQHTILHLHYCASVTQTDSYLLLKQVNCGNILMRTVSHLFFFFFKTVVISYDIWSCSQGPDFPWANGGRHLRVKSVKRERIMTRLVRCKEGMLRTKRWTKMLSASWLKGIKSKWNRNHHTEHGSAWRNTANSLTYRTLHQKPKKWHQNSKPTSWVGVLICAKEGH